MLTIKRRAAPLILLVAWLAAAPGPRLRAQEQGPPPGNDAQAGNDDQNNQAPYANLSPDQIQRLVAPIALYPDSLVAQILGACTFPSQIVEADNWVKAHQGLSPQDLGAQADQMQWDPSVKALIQFPDVLSNLSSNLGWTSELGDAYYNQQPDVMNAVQVMRQKAQQAGNLKSTQQEKVQNNSGQIQIEPASPDVVYVPAYDPWAVYGYPITPWPYWVDVPGIWWGGPGLYFGVGFPLAPFFGFGWGWRAWGLDWGGHRVFYNRAPYFARGRDFFDRRGFYGGRGDFGRAGELRGGFRGNFGGSARGGGVRGGNEYRGFQAPRGSSGVHSGAFSGINHGGTSRGFSARGQSSTGGFHGGGFSGGSFHGGGGGGRHH